MKFLSEPGYIFLFIIKEQHKNSGFEILKQSLKLITAKTSNKLQHFHIFAEKCKEGNNQLIIKIFQH